MKPIIFLLSLFFLMRCSVSVDAAEYTFSEIYRSDSRPILYPAINNNGIVAYTSDTGTLVTTDGITSTLIAGPSARYSVTQSSQIVSVNDLGFVAFLGTDSAFPGIPMVLASDGTTVRTIATPDSFEAIDPPIQSDFRQWFSINNDGLVAFSVWTNAWPPSNPPFGPLGRSRAYVGNGVSAPTLVGPFADYSDVPAINSNGVVAYRRTRVTPDYIHEVAIEASPPTASSPDVVISGLWEGSAVDINDAGVVAFSDGSRIVITDGISSTIVEGSETFRSLSLGYVITPADPALAINNHGTVAFGATWGDSYPWNMGIFTGPDPMADKVIETGDLLFEANVVSLLFGREGFNDLGQVAFVAELDDGTSGVFVATPVPEPSTLVLTTLALGLLLIAWRRIF